MVQEGKFIPRLEAHPQVFAFERKLEGEGGAEGQGSAERQCGAEGQGGGSLLVFCNFYGTETECEHGVSLDGYRKILGNYPEIGADVDGGTVDGTGKLQLKPYEVVVLEK